MFFQFLDGGHHPAGLGALPFPDEPARHETQIPKLEIAAFGPLERRFPLPGGHLVAHARNRPDVGHALARARRTAKIERAHEDDGGNRGRDPEKSSDIEKHDAIIAAAPFRFKGI
ncbi:MAG: hypothetical protein ACI4Q3_00110 [Kiritimatiellia bacterium]